MAAPVLKSAFQLKTSCCASGNVFVFSSDTVWGVGDNMRGQINDAVDVERDVPLAHPQALRLPTSVVVVGVSVGDLHMVVCARDGAVYGRGSDALGQLGHIRTNGRLSNSFPKLIVPMQQLDFFKGKPVRQTFCLRCATIFALANDTVFMCGENQSPKWTVAAPVEVHVPLALPEFGPHAGQAQLRGVAFSNVVLWITSAGRVLLSNSLGKMIPSPLLPDTYRSVACVADLVVAVPERGEAVSYIGKNPLQHNGAHPTVTSVLRAVDTDTILGCVGVAGHALVLTEDAQYIMTVEPARTELLVDPVKWSPFTAGVKAVEACLNPRGIALVDDERRVSFFHVARWSAEPMPLPEHRVRPSLGGNMLSLLFWRRELHHLCGTATARIVFYLLCCLRLHRGPFGRLPRDVLYYILSYIPMF